MSNYKNLKINVGDLQNKSFKELSLIKNLIFWIDIFQIGENYINAIFTRPFNQKDKKPQKLTVIILILKVIFMDMEVNLINV